MKQEIFATNGLVEVRRGSGSIRRIISLVSPVLVQILLIASVGGCQSSSHYQTSSGEEFEWVECVGKVDGKLIFFKGTECYRLKVLSLPISEKRAEELLSAHTGTTQNFVTQRIIIDDDYVFSHPHKMGIDTRATYVNGITGQVHFEHGFGAVRPLK